MQQADKHQHLSNKGRGFVTRHARASGHDEVAKKSWIPATPLRGKDKRKFEMAEVNFEIALKEEAQRSAPRVKIRLNLGVG